MAAGAPEEPQGSKRDREEATEAGEEEPPKKEQKAEEAAEKSREVEVGRDAVAWLAEDASRRLRKLGAIAEADLEASAEGSGLVVRPREGASGGLEWAEFCVRAMCALRTGQVVDARPPAAEGGQARPLTVVEVPRDEARGFVAGKAGERLLKLSEELDIIAAFGQEVSSSLSLEVGALIEAKYEGKDRWFEAKVIELGKTSVKVKWTYDDDVPESTVSLEDVRAPEDGGQTSEASPLEVGALVDAKFGGKDRLFEAIVLRIDEKTVKVKWTYDEDVPPSEVSRADVKARPKIPTDPLYIAGPLRGRLELELKVLTLIESKVPGFVSSRPRASDECSGVGLSVVPLMNDGEMKAKVIGKGGLVRQKIAKTCGSCLDYIGTSAYVVGTSGERAHTAKVLELVQVSASGAVDSVPSELEAICTRVTVPYDASFMVTGKQRATMNQIEEESGTLMFWAPAAAVAAAPAAVEGELELTVGKFIQGRFNKKWFEATILEIIEDKSGERSAKVRWDYDETEVSVVAASDIREVPSGKDAEPPARGDAGDVRTLAIFGPERPRKLAELRVMSTVEQKCPGTYKDVEVTASGDGFGHEVLRLGPQEAQRCGEKRQYAAAAAAHCCLEQIGDAAHLAGTGAERARARDYIRWLAMETPSVPEASSREDVDVLSVPEGKRANLVEHAVAPIEKDTETLAFFEGGTAADADARLFVCGHDSAKRAVALAKLREQQERAPPRRPDPDDDGVDFWGASKPSQKVVYVVTKDEEERRRKRAERFAVPPAKKR